MMLPLRAWPRTRLLALLLGAAVCTVLVSTALGPVHIPIPEVFRVLAKWALDLFGDSAPDKADAARMIVLQLRLPRVLLAALVGAGLATAGGVMQGLFRNPMASPYVIGISSGASFGAAVAMLLFSLFLWVPLLAFAAGVVTVFLVYRISRQGREIVMETLLLSGIAVGLFFSAATSLLMYVRSESLHFLVFWIMGGFSGRSWNHVLSAAPVICAGVPLMCLLARELNVLQLGEDTASHLGINVEHLKTGTLILASLVTAAAVSVSGVIGFVGLIIPHITRLIVGPDHRVLLPASALVGAVFLVWCDNVARTLIAPTELPVGVITAFCGAPFFIYLLRKRLTSRLSG